MIENSYAFNFAVMIYGKIVQTNYDIPYIHSELVIRTFINFCTITIYKLGYLKFQRFLFFYHTKLNDNFILKAYIHIKVEGV
jgi:hypothetical protein